MKIAKRERMFRTGKSKGKQTVSLNTPIINALKVLSERTGEDISEIVSDVLDQYLTEMVKQKHLEPPDVLENVVLTIQLAKEASD